MYLKTKSVEIQSLGKTIEIRELNAKAEHEMILAHNAGEPVRAAAVSVKYGWPGEVSEMSVDQIMEEFPRRIITEISEAVLGFSGEQAKNSESTPGDGSSTD